MARGPRIGESDPRVELAVAVIYAASSIAVALIETRKPAEKPDKKKPVEADSFAAYVKECKSFKS